MKQMAQKPDLVTWLLLLLHTVMMTVQEVGYSSLCGIARHENRQKHLVFFPSVTFVRHPRFLGTGHDLTGTPHHAPRGWSRVRYTEGIQKVSNLLTPRFVGLSCLHRLVGPSSGTIQGGRLKIGPAALLESQLEERTCIKAPNSDAQYYHYQQLDTASLAVEGSGEISGVKGETRRH
ncbi:hypothetical protein B0T14DRAFT_82976 [Immersiella caudata]|uniref:Secreted protein n=1 Tax=Immersiella caudata TaxID=314043 RepID=A0AA39XHP0_9PEZI|nr:hypothetical protein B0T14DRAFT_82976 [Immersiella caudata]